MSGSLDADKGRVDRHAHWDRIYEAKGDQQVSWFEESPRVSLKLIREAGVPRHKAVIDVGGGASRLVDALLDQGQAAVTVLDLSVAALRIAKERIGPNPRVNWVEADVTTWAPDREYGLWHDRAAFHFLLDPAEQAAYARVLDAALASDGIAIIGSFAPDGPEKCSGLPVQRHDGSSILAILGPDFALVGEHLHEHVTPWGAKQRFQFSTFRRR